MVSIPGARVSGGVRGVRGMPAGCRFAFPAGNAMVHRRRAGAGIAPSMSLSRGRACPRPDGPRATGRVPRGGGAPDAGV